MAGADWHSTPAVALLAALEKEPHRFDFFQLMRRVECLQRDIPRLGRAALPRDEAVRIGQPPSAIFAPSTLAESGHGPGAVPRVNVNFLGLLGPQGPLPAHITELAHNRARDWGDRSLQRFFDMFDHRMLLFFYRAWADAHAVVGLDRSDREGFDAFEWHLAALSGRSGEEYRRRDAMPDPAKMYFSGHLSAIARRPSGIRRMLSALLGVTITLLDYFPRWLDLPREGRWRLGTPHGFSQLGHTAILGERVFDVQCSLRVIAGPMKLAKYLDFLPGSIALSTLSGSMDNILGKELQWDLNLTLEAEQVPVLRLGDSNARLGWTTWLGERKASAAANDLVLRPLRNLPVAA